MPTSIFEIYACNRKIGIAVARNEKKALKSAYYATTRHTDSKIDVSCDYEGLVARKLVGNASAIGDKLTSENPVVDRA
jgi:hypothetical protein